MKMKSIGLLAGSFLFAVVSCKKGSSPNNDPELLGPESGKVIHYSFNNTLNDGSGNNLNAVLYGDPLTYAADRFGRANQAAVFPGPTNSVIVGTPSISEKITGFPFSVSLWFKTASVIDYQTLVRADGGESSSYSGFWLQVGVGGEGTLSFSFGDNTSNTSSSRNTITTPAVFSADTWYHVAVNVRGANDMEFYINGVKNTACTYSGDATAMVFNPAYTTGLLGNFPGASSSFEGLMDDYRIYSKTLSQAEVSALYNFHP
jgi:hypothetical protein